MWLKLGDEFVDDAADLSDGAYRTYIDLVAWSNRRGLDLTVPKRDQRRFAFSPHADQGIAELVNLGWLTDDGDTWTVRYRPEWQLTKEQVEATRLKNLRATWHRRGRHDLCDPARCPSAPSSDYTTDDAPDDRADDTSDDPGRVGTVREERLEEPTTEVRTAS